MGNNDTMMDDLAAVEQKMKTVMDMYVERSYRLYYLNGDDESYEQMEHQLLEYVEKDLLMIEQAIERITDENGSIVEQLSEIEREVDV